MSGLARKIKKVFKKKFKFHKKYWKVAAIAVAAYFTFGAALGAMGPAAGATATAGATGAGTAAAAGGAGVFSATGAAATVAGIETVTVTAAATGGFSAAAGATAAAAAGGAALSAAGSGGGSGAQGTKEFMPGSAGNPAANPNAGGQSVIGQGGGGAGAGGGAGQSSTSSLLSKAKGAWNELSFSDKLLLAKAGVDVIAASKMPTPEEEAAAAAKWQGAFYGHTAESAEKAVGGTQFFNRDSQPSKPGVAGGVGRAQRQLFASDPAARPGTPDPQAAAAPAQFRASAPEAQEPVEQDTPEQVTDVGGGRDLFAKRAKNVRYLV